MTKALGENKAQSVLGRITPTESNKPIEILDWMDARSVAELISDEHPQIMALIISYLEAGVAADVLVLLPGDVQSDIIHRIATHKTVLTDVPNLRVMQLKFKTNTSSSLVCRRNKSTASIMNYTSLKYNKSYEKPEKKIKFSEKFESMFI